MQLLTAEALVEALNTSAGVNQLLLTSVERMALGANFDVDLGLGGTSLDDVAASAGDGAVNVVRMDTLFHSFHLISGSDVSGPYYNVCAHHNLQYRLPPRAALETIALIL